MISPQQYGMTANYLEGGITENQNKTVGGEASNKPVQELQGITDPQLFRDKQDR